MLVRQEKLVLPVQLEKQGRKALQDSPVLMELAQQGHDRQQSYRVV
jgi:hypothetical protein